jgi:excisionase family DNA binding protein
MSLYGTMKKTYRIAPEVKEQILKRIKETGIPVAEAAKEYGLHESTIYNWLGRGVKGAPTVGELVRLKRKNEELLALVGEITLQLSQSQKKN